MRLAAHHRSVRFIAPAGAAIVIAVLAATPFRLPEPSASSGHSRGGYVSRLAGTIKDDAEHVIILGGIVLERNRHLAAGSAIGCAIGAGLGAATTGALALVTGGGALAALPTVSTLGCAVFGSAGAVFGAPLDDYQADL
jgi:hypothetical protein